MFAVKSVTVLFSMMIYVFHCKRRINDGQDLKKDRGYVVYLVKAPVSDVAYDAWLCGGAIVSSEFVVTSAACVTDVEFLYVISGYRKYIPDNQVETDRCTSTMKKKVIYTCKPKSYIMKPGELDYWADLDIALVKVESPFDFNDPKYETLCSYKPTTIPINYDEKYQEAGEDALVFGWGHDYTWRRPGDTQNYNQPVLKYTPTLLMDKQDCVRHYKNFVNMSKLITKYVVCTLGKGNIDDEGRTIQKSLSLINGCTTKQQKLLGFEGVSCESGEASSDYDDTRRSNKGSNDTNNVNLTDFNNMQARRNGICQNDHGGPLITWSGASEILIGVASVFKVSEEYECMGPYLYTSTYCMALFLNCILNSDVPGRRFLCDRPASERGFDTIERTISWKNYPAGSVENENIGRTGTEPILSPGLKYLMKNNQPLNAENENVASNSTFQPYKIPPIVSDASKKRFSVQERGPKSILAKKNPVNDGHQEEPESNKMYLANNRPVPVSNEPKDKFKIKERMEERKNISEKQSLLMNDKSPEKSTFLANGRSSEKQTFSVNERYPFNKRQQSNERNSPGMRAPGFQENQRPLENKRIPSIGRYPFSKGPKTYFQKIPARMTVRSVHPIP